MTTGFGVFEAKNNSVVMRTIYISATVLLMSDVVQCADIARGDKRNFKSVHFWIYAFYLGYSWAILMVLMLWEGIENFQISLITWSISGAAFGTVMAFSTVGDPQLLSKRFDIERPLTGYTLGSLYYFTPLILSLMIIWLIWYNPTMGWAESHLLFLLIFLGSLAPLYPYCRKNLWRNQYPRLLGAALLLTGLLAFR